MSPEELKSLVATTLGGGLTEDDHKWIQRVAKVCEASYLIEPIEFAISKRVRKKVYSRTSNRVHISETAWKHKNGHERRSLLRHIVCELVDYELHGKNAKGWELDSLLKETQRRLGH